MLLTEERRISVMSDTGGPYLFDVGVIALAHSSAPVRDAALSYVREGIAGEIDAVVPYPALFGAHTVLTTYYGYSNGDASRLLENFMDASRIHWYDQMSQDVVRGAFSRAGEANVGGWDGYYAQVAINEGVGTVLTIDDDFERFDAFETEVILSPDEFAELNSFLQS
ncbi:Predicted nucleic acid-binding protein, contains PIN domain [Halorubrum ezzemoulense]|uniref:Predicted nucleic acid-binding protein, contains PIN domain n=2 Tax=Halorubrum ezzemoulense TaxID=337243 RepID=A0A238YML9_HALEZ|nr:Predicted nucleic acid-binding protein, contains PIN domain [Halorubrum ezzemoulense]